MEISSITLDGYNIRKLVLEEQRFYKLVFAAGFPKSKRNGRWSLFDKAQHVVIEEIIKGIKSEYKHDMGHINSRVRPGWAIGFNRTALAFISMILDSADNDGNLDRAMINLTSSHRLAVPSHRLSEGIDRLDIVDGKLCLPDRTSILGEQTSDDNRSAKVKTPITISKDDVVWIYKTYKRANRLVAYAAQLYDAREIVSPSLSITKAQRETLPTGWEPIGHDLHSKSSRNLLHIQRKYGDDTDMLSVESTRGYTRGYHCALLVISEAILNNECRFILAIENIGFKKKHIERIRANIFGD